ncbi:hypothetical protein PISMIDRAFT_687831 [Pisolithus microcarpus 441]|uniref:Uncharacterized protein n=1 Tax=Pisolithus microcarpus 441 TaxID=765257 RepID=A0A0C9YD22_9AGAM|nr:hypothetical protein PISMIDRAFT_687831 [Pisolithus microcarpus 441]
MMSGSYKSSQGFSDTFMFPHAMMAGGRAVKRCTHLPTVKGDVAYSLIGKFKPDVPPHYGEGPDALGHLWRKS